jgi:hypothetical protein
MVEKAKVKEIEFVFNEEQRNRMKIMKKRFKMMMKFF